MTVSDPSSSTPVARGRLIVLCGLPGSGKTTTARLLAETDREVRLCSDEWMTLLGFDLYDDEARFRTETLQQQFLEELLLVGCTVVYESGGWTRVERDALRERARATGAAVELRFLDVPLDLLWKRVSHRNHDLPSVTAIVEREDLVRWWSEFQRPKADEQAQYDPAR